MSLVKLRPDGGSLTATRRVSYFVYGRWSVTTPEGIEKERPAYLDEPIEYPDGATDEDKRALDLKRELERDSWDDRLTDGYIARTDSGDLGRFDFGFVRADASMDMNTGASDVEQQIRTGIKRSDGDIFFQADVSGAGLGKAIPRVDYSTGSTVDARIWSVDIPSLVTSIADIPRDTRVHLGGQLAADAESLRSRNAQIESQIAADRKKNKREIDTAKSAATSAKSTAEQAKQTADETAALVKDLDIDGSIQEAREAVDASNELLKLVRQFTGAAAAQGAQAQASASMAIEYARQAELILDQLDPLRDDVVEAHAEVARLSGEAARAAQEAAATVARGEQHVLAAQRAATAAAADASESQQLVEEAKAKLAELAPLQDKAKETLADAQELLDNVDGSGQSLADVLAEIAAKHQEVLSAHDDILTTHGEILEIHGEAIRYAAMAAAQAGAAAMQASQAAAEALRAADLNSQAIAALAEADKKLIEADQKLQEQIDVLEESQRLLAQAVRYVAAAAAQAAQAAMSAAQATEENANAIEQTNVAVDAAADSVEALQKASAARDEVMGNIQKSVNSAAAAASSLEKSQAAFEDTLLIQQNAIFWGEVHRTRIFDKYSMSTVTNNELMTMTPIESDRKLRLDFKGIWGGRVQVIGRMVDAWGKNSRVDFFSYGAGPGYRRLIVEPEVVNYGIDKVHVVVDMWWPNRALEFVFVPKAGGGWEIPPYEDSIQGGVNLGLMHEGTMIVYWPRGKGYRASRAVQVTPDDGRTWKTYSAGALLPASASIGGYQVTGIRPVRGDTRPVKLTEQI